MDDKELTVRRWVTKAEHDLLTARTMLGTETPPADVVCFHCQQCAEKTLKAFPVLRDQDFPKTHDLKELLVLCERHDAGFATLRDNAAGLTDYAVQPRYADDWRDIPVDEASKALALARHAMEFVLPRLRLFSEGGSPG
ncbi:MAG: HEPN domain-containing protein [Planctomycetota bacterium]